MNRNIVRMTVLPTFKLSRDVFVDEKNRHHKLALMKSLILNILNKVRKGQKVAAVDFDMDTQEVVSLHVVNSEIEEQSITEEQYFMIEIIPSVKVRDDLMVKLERGEESGR